MALRHGILLSIGLLAAAASGAAACSQDDNSAAPAPAKGPCTYRDKVYAAGETFMIDDCNSCSCRGDGDYSCTLLGCPVCVDHKGLPHETGSRYYDDCNYCHCESGGQATCTALSCPAEPGPTDAGHDAAASDAGDADAANPAENDADAAEDAPAD